MFRVVFYRGFRAFSDGRDFPTWNDASGHLDGLVGGDCTGGYIEEYVSGIGWVVQDTDPNMGDNCQS